jgi:hypothetical protein
MSQFFWAEHFRGSNTCWNQLILGVKNKLGIIFRPVTEIYQNKIMCFKEKVGSSEPEQLQNEKCQFQNITLKYNSKNVGHLLL